MAKTYFGYQPQAREAQINWNEIATEVSGSITGALQDRADKKAAINQASRDYIGELNSVEQGQHATANQWWLQAAHQLEQQMLMQDRLLKNGTLKLNEYTIMRQNLTDGTDNMIKVFNDFQTTYADKVARAQGGNDELGESQKLESWAFEQVQSFFNFDESGFLVNPETSNVSIGKLDPDGGLIADPNALQSASTFNSLVLFNADKYDLEAASATYVDELGTWDTISRRIGSDKAKGLITKMRTNGWDKELTTEEIKQLGLSVEEGEAFNIYLAGEDLFLSDIMSNPYHTSSILTNSLGVYNGEGQGSGEVFTFTRNKDEAGGNMIYVNQDNPGGMPNPEYTEEQEELVQEAIRASVRSKVDVEVVSTQVVDDDTRRAPTASESKSAATAQTKKDIMGQWAQVGYGTQQEKVSAMQGIIASDLVSDRSIDDVNFTTNAGGGVTIDFISSDPAFQREPITLPPNFTEQQWNNVGAELLGITGQEAIDFAAGSYIGRDGERLDLIRTDFPTGNIGARGTEASPTQVGVATIQNKVTDNMFLGQDRGDTIRELRALISGVPNISIESSGMGLVGNSITIKNTKTREEVIVNTNPVSYTHLTLPTILLV